MTDNWSKAPIKRCPFCDSGLTISHDVSPKEHLMQCWSCRAEGPVASSEEGASLKWNERRYRQMIEVHHICLSDQAKDVLDRYAKKTGKTVDQILEDIVHEAVDEIETWKLGE